MVLDCGILHGYYVSLQLKRLQTCKVIKEILYIFYKYCIFWTFNFDLLQFCSPLSHKDAWYLIEKSSFGNIGSLLSKEQRSSFRVCVMISKDHLYLQFLITVSE